ncbi:hypothetical protein F5879DRAFT_925634 [Lentinula edodes]|nr:hypothetical protein F5879DRAFT_925634 [Lentinula edodes]
MSEVFNTYLGGVHVQTGCTKLMVEQITCVKDAWPADRQRRMLMGEVVLDIIHSSKELSDLTIEGYFLLSLLCYSLPGPLNHIHVPWNFVQNVDKNAGVIDLDMTWSQIISGFRDYFVMFPAVETLAFKVRGLRDTREDINSVLEMYPGVREVTIIWEDSTELMESIKDMLGEHHNIRKVRCMGRGSTRIETMDLQQMMMGVKCEFWLNGNSIASDEVLLMIAINVYDSNRELAKQRVEDIFNFMMASKQFQRVGVEALHGLLDVHSADRLQCVMEGWRRDGEHYKITWPPDLLVGLSDLVSNSSRLAQVSINGYKLGKEFYNRVQGLSRPMKLSVTQCLMQEIITPSQGGLKFSELVLQQNTISTVRNWGANVELASMIVGSNGKDEGDCKDRSFILLKHIGNNWRQLAVRFPDLKHICVRTVGGYKAGEDITAVLEFYKVRELTIIWESSQFLGISKVNGIDIKGWQLWLKWCRITTSIRLNGGLLWHTFEE